MRGPPKAHEVRINNANAKAKAAVQLKPPKSCLIHVDRFHGPKFREQVNPLNLLRDERE